MRFDDNKKRLELLVTRISDKLSPLNYNVFKISILWIQKLQSVRELYMQFLAELFRILWARSQSKREGITISSPVCNGDICYSSTPARFDRTIGNALYLSLSRQPFLWADTDLARMAAEAVEIGSRNFSTLTRFTAFASRNTASATASACPRCGSFCAATNL